MRPYRETPHRRQVQSTKDNIYVWTDSLLNLIKNIDRTTTIPSCSPFEWWKIYLFNYETRRGTMSYYKEQRLLSSKLRDIKIECKRSVVVRDKMKGSRRERLRLLKNILLFCCGNKGHLEGRACWLKLIAFFTPQKLLYFLRKCSVAAGDWSASRRR